MGSRITWMLLLCVSYSASETLIEDPVYVMKHDLGQGTFSNRGTIQLPGAKRKDAEPQVSQSELDGDELLSMNSHTNHRFYRLKMSADRDSEDNSTLVMGFTCLKELKSASLHDTITIFTDELGNAISVSVQPVRNGIASGDYAEFETTVLMQKPNPAPVPDTAGFIEKLREEKIQKEKADKDPKSFLGKYWIYIIPVVFIMFMSSAQQQQ